jgi:hypothetical protein
MMNEHIDYHALSPHTAGMLSHYLYGMFPRKLHFGLSADWCQQ